MNAVCFWTAWTIICILVEQTDEFYRFDNGADDNPAGVSKQIAADGSQAFSYFGLPGHNKVFKLIEPIFESNGNPLVTVDLNVDFKIVTSGLNAVASSGTAAALWGSAKWGFWALGLRKSNL